MFCWIPTALSPCCCESVVGIECCEHVVRTLLICIDRYGLSSEGFLVIYWWYVQST